MAHVAANAPDEMHINLLRNWLIDQSLNQSINIYTISADAFRN